MVRTTASTTSLASSAHRSAPLPPSALGRRGLRSAPRSSTCATRTPLYMAEDAETQTSWPVKPAAARHQSWVARAGNRRLALLRLPAGGGETDAEMATAPRRGVPRTPQGRGVRSASPRPMFPNPPGLLPIEPFSPGLRERIWWGAASPTTAAWAAAMGMNLMSSTLVFDDASGDPLPPRASAPHPRVPRGVARGWP